jgi:hypothetical protein
VACIAIAALARRAKGFPASLVENASVTQQNHKVNQDHDIWVTDAELFRVFPLTDRLAYM